MSNRTDKQSVATKSLLKNHLPIIREHNFYFKKVLGKKLNSEKEIVYITHIWPKCVQDMFEKS